MRGIYPRGDSYQAKRYYAKTGKRVNGTFPTKEEAVAFLASCDLAVVRGDPLPDPKGAGSTVMGRTKTLRELFEATVKLNWSGNRSQASVENGRQFLNWAGPSTPVKEAFTPDRLDEYVIYRMEELGNSGSTINKKISAIQVMQKRAFRGGLITGIVPMARQKAKKGRIRYWTVAEERAIIDATLSLGLTHWAEYWKFLCDTGARPGEATKLVWTDFRQKAVIIPEDISKASPTRVIDLTEEAQTAVRHRRDDPATMSLAGPFSFAGKGKRRMVWDKLRGLLPWLDGPDDVPYAFRHTFGSRLAMRGAPPLFIKEMMGHSSLTMTEKYTHLSPLVTRGVTSLLENFQDPGIGPEPVTVRGKQTLETVDGGTL